MISNLWLPGNNTRLYIHIICTVTRSIFRYMLKCIEICIYIYIYKWARDYYINKFHWTINGKRGLALLDLFVAFVEPYHGRHSVEQNHVHEMSPLRQKSLGFDAKLHQNRDFWEHYFSQWQYIKGRPKYTVVYKGEA